MPTYRYVAVGPDGLVLWANRAMDKFIPRRTRLRAPLVETLRDPDVLDAISHASLHQRVSSARALSLVPGRTFDVMGEDTRETFCMGPEAHEREPARAAYLQVPL